MTNSGVARKKACPQSIFSTLFARDAASGYQYCSNLFKSVSQPTSCLFHSLLPVKDRATDTPIRATPKRPQIPTCTKITCCSTDSYRPHRCCHLHLYACIYVRIYLCTVVAAQWWYEQMFLSKCSGISELYMVYQWLLLVSAIKYSRHMCLQTKRLSAIMQCADTRHNAGLYASRATVDQPGQSTSLPPTARWRHFSSYFTGSQFGFFWKICTTKHFGGKDDRPTF